MIAIGYDVGSSFVKAALFDIESGKSLAVERSEQEEIENYKRKK